MQTSCDYCAYNEYDEEADEYFCSVNMDEDDMAKEVPGFDLVLFGHDHTRDNETVTNTDGKQVVCLDPANNAAGNNATGNDRTGNNAAASCNGRAGCYKGRSRRGRRCRGSRTIRDY